MMLTSAYLLGTHSLTRRDRRDPKGAVKSSGGCDSLYSRVGTSRKKEKASSMVGRVTERKGVEASCRS